MEYELLLVISWWILLTLTLVDFHYHLLDTLWITWKKWLHDGSRSTILIPLLTGTTITRNLINLSCQQNGRVHTIKREKGILSTLLDLQGHGNCLKLLDSLTRCGEILRYDCLIMTGDNENYKDDDLIAPGTWYITVPTRY